MYKTIVRSGVRAHALFRGPDLESGALDRSAILTSGNSDWVGVDHNIRTAQLQRGTKSAAF